MKLSLVKTGTFASVHFTVAFAIAWLLTGSLAIAGAIALIEPVANTVAYFLHERVWARVDAASARTRAATGEPAGLARPAPRCAVRADRAADAASMRLRRSVDASLITT